MAGDAPTLADRPDYAQFCEGALANPYPLFRDLRAHDPIHWSDRLGAWVITRYDDVLDGLVNPAIGSDRIAVNASALPPEQRDRVSLLLEHVSNWLGFTDPPKHTRLRKLLMSTFTPRLAEQMRPRIQEIADGLLDQAQDRGPRIDLLNDYAFPLPAMVIYELLGIPVERQQEFRSWVDGIVPFVGGVGPSLIAVADPANEAAQQLTAYFRELASSGELTGRTSLLALLADEHRRGEMTEQELLGLVVFVFAAGHETTISLIGNGLVLLLSNAHERERLMADWSLAPTAVEEALRYESPVQISPRLALDDVDLRGRRIRSGDAVILVNAAANRDPDVFPAPDRFDVGRRDNRHLAFGWARHFCLGAPLARVEGQIAFRTILTRLPDLRLDDGSIQWVHNMSVRCPTAIPASY